MFEAVDAFGDFFGRFSPLARIARKQVTDVPRGDTVASKEQALVPRGETVALEHATADLARVVLAAVEQHQVPRRQRPNHAGHESQKVTRRSPGEIWNMVVDL